MSLIHDWVLALVLICRSISRGATAETVKKAFEILLRDPKVKSIFINIFGGIMRCDYIAEGVIKATKELQLDIPLVVRLKGTKEVEAKQYVSYGMLRKKIVLTF